MWVITSPHIFYYLFLILSYLKNFCIKYFTSFGVIVLDIELTIINGSIVFSVQTNVQ